MLETLPPAKDSAAQSASSLGPSQFRFYLDNEWLADFFPNARFYGEHPEIKMGPPVRVDLKERPAVGPNGYVEWLEFVPPEFRQRQTEGPQALAGGNA